MLSITNFISSIIQEGGLLNPTRYHFLINSPLGIMPHGLDMKIASVPWPGKSVETIDSYVGLGPNIKVPIGEIYDDLPITFYSSKNLAEWEYWNKWMEYISGKTNFLIKNYKDIIGEAELAIIDEQGNYTKRVKLVACYPTILSPIEMGYEMTNQIATFQVTLIYHHFEVLN